MAGWVSDWLETGIECVCVCVCAVHKQRQYHYSAIATHYTLHVLCTVSVRVCCMRLPSSEHGKPKANEKNPNKNIYNVSGGNWREATKRTHTLTSNVLSLVSVHMLQFTLLVISQHSHTLAPLPPWILKRVSTFGCFDIDAMFVFQVNFGAIGRKSRRHICLNGKHWHRHPSEMENDSGNRGKCGNGSSNSSSYSYLWVQLVLINT